MRLLISMLLLLSACGARTRLVVDAPRRDGGTISDAGLDAGWDAGFDAGHDAGFDAGWDAGLDAGPPRDAGACLFDDGAERGAGAWEFGSLWNVSDVRAHTGTRSLVGYWMNWDVGCPGTSAVRMTTDVDLRDVGAATLRFSQLGGICEFDTLRIVASTDRGRTWFAAGTPPDPQWSGWTTFAVDLGSFAGQPAVRFGFEFDNVCGDPCGVEWYIDDVSICAR